MARASLALALLLPLAALLGSPGVCAAGERRGVQEIGATVGYGTSDRGNVQLAPLYAHAAWFLPDCVDKPLARHNSQYLSVTSRDPSPIKGLTECSALVSNSANVFSIFGRIPCEGKKACAFMCGCWYCNGAIGRGANLVSEGRRGCGCTVANAVTH